MPITKRKFGSPAAGAQSGPATSEPCLAVGETVILPHPPLPLVGVSIAMERGRQQNDRTLADGYAMPELHVGVHLRQHQRL